MRSVRRKVPLYMFVLSVFIEFAENGLLLWPRQIETHLLDPQWAKKLRVSLVQLFEKVHNEKSGVL